MFRRLLIANRGEIACRIIETARRLGIETIAVYSDADAGARHVRLADRALRLGPAPAAESYLSIEKILEAARASGAEALHPGYGFLSENPALAEACAAAGIVFVGPSPAAIRAMGDKSAAKQLLERAGVPLTPGYHGDDQSPEVLQREAARVGYPVLIKASAGGGGKGMRRVDAPGDFEAALASCRREASQAFGSDRVLVEKYVLEPRHIEVQIFGDRHGHYVHLFERDCSVQRRHQKVLEESPAPGMTAERRARMGQAAIEAARAVDYVGAGTVELIAAPDGQFYFMEMNTRLQVEHPVTEKVTGVDLVEWQLRVAAGEPLPLQQEQLALRGHAIEARLYAENPDLGFLPSAGTLRHLSWPPTSPAVRIDRGVDEGDTITSFYDPMIAKLIVWGEDREQALGRLRAALAAVEIVGVGNNVELLQRLVRTPSFAEARLDTALIEREREALAPPPDEVPALVWKLGAVAELARAAAGAERDRPGSPWSRLDGWRLSDRVAHRIALRRGHHSHEVSLTEEERAQARVLAGGEEARVAVIELEDQGRLARARAVPDGRRWQLFLDGRRWELEVVDPLAVQLADERGESALRAPMPGRVTAHKVAIGARVAKGTPLVLLEAMKMELAVVAPYDGRVERFVYQPGDQVTEGAELVELERVSG